MPPEADQTQTTTTQPPLAAKGGADQGGADQSTTTTKPQKPEGLSDALGAFWNDDTGFDYAKLGTDFAALSTLKAEHDSRVAQVPEKIEDYEVALPTDFQAPEGFKLDIKSDDPDLAVARDFAKKNGLTKDEFKNLIGLRAQLQIAQDARLKTATDAERAKLGTKGAQRINAMTTWMNSALGTELANTLLPTIYTAKQVEAYERIMQLAKGAGPKLTTTGREITQSDKLTEEQYKALSPTQRIARANKLAEQKRQAG